MELRAVALETRAELMLDLGRHRELIGELVEVVAEFPVRERLRYQLMLALYRSGRQAEALAAYREFGDLLRQEYGIEPGDVLQELHRRILRSDPSLALAVSAKSPQPHRPPAAGPPTVGLPAAAPPAGSAAARAGSAAQAGSAPAHPSFTAEPLTGSAARAATPAPVPVVPVQPQPAMPTDRFPGMPLFPPPPAFPVAERNEHLSRRNPSEAIPRWLSVSATVVAALAALFSFGLLTWLVVLVYAGWRRSWRNGVVALGYLAFAVTVVALIGTGEEEITDAEGVLTLAWLVTWILGVFHTVLLNGAVWSAITRRGKEPPLSVVDEHRIRREQARYLLYHYPAARQELHIGRPDLPRTFDDGGLVDVNAVQEATIAGLPGITASHARQVVMDRWLRGPFGSMEDLAARCLLPPPLTEPLRDLLIFLPHPHPHPTVVDQEVSVGIPARDDANLLINSGSDVRRW
ncbi:hypothetical protein GCM10027614_56600 [Micromonospora vulcania]